MDTNTLATAQNLDNDDAAETCFGAAARSHFLLEDGLTYLNHGSYGATSKPVMAAAQLCRERIERQPCRFMGEDLPVALRQTADRVGDYVGAKGDDIVFLDNATTAINAVLRSLVLFPGVDVLTTTLTYGAVMRTLEFVCDRAEARLIPVHIDYPVPDAETVVDRLVSAITSRTRLLVIDHITSRGSAVLPLAEIAAEFADRGIQVLVDGAHGPGMLDLDVESLGVTWYTGNCHKWLGAPRGSAFLWTAPDRQAFMRPTTISHYVANGYIPAFDWPGTKDFTPYLTIPDALDFRARFGEDAIRAYCHDLACRAGEYLARELGTVVGTRDSMTPFMVSVALPKRFGAAKQDVADALIRKIRDEHHLEVAIHAFEGRLWARLSFYIYNDMEDVDRLLHALKSVE